MHYFTGTPTPGTTTGNCTVQPPKSRKMPFNFKESVRLARAVAEASPDKSRKVGAVIQRNDHEDAELLATGFNAFHPGSLFGADPMMWLKENKLMMITHAEVNAVANAAKAGKSIDGAIMISTYFPCLECAKVIVAAGIKTLYVPAPNWPQGKFKWAHSYFYMQNRSGLATKQPPLIDVRFYDEETLGIFSLNPALTEEIYSKVMAEIDGAAKPQGGRE